MKNAEMRDLETISTALTAAETGHLVLATLHTPSAVGTAERIVSVFSERAQVQAAIQTASSLLAVLSQRLIPTVEKTRRVLATEVLLGNSAAQHVIRERQFYKLPDIITSGFRQGMHSLERSLAELYRTGVITRANAFSYANSPADLEALLKDSPPAANAPREPLTRR